MEASRGETEVARDGVACPEEGGIRPRRRVHRL